MYIIRSVFELPAPPTCRFVSGSLDRMTCRFALKELVHGLVKSGNMYIVRYGGGDGGTRRGGEGVVSKELPPLGGVVPPWEGFVLPLERVVYSGVFVLAGGVVIKALFSKPSFTSQYTNTY